MDILRVICVVHHSNLDRNTLLFCLQIDNIIEEMSAVTVYVTDEFLQTILSVENLLLGLTFLVRAQIFQGNLDTCIEECQLAHTVGNDVPLIDSVSKDGWIWPELLACTALVGFTYHLNRIERLTLLIFLLVDFAATEHL